MSVPATVPFLPVATSSAPMGRHLACLAVEEPQVGWPHRCHLPRLGTSVIAAAAHLARFPAAAADVIAPPRWRPLTVVGDSAAVAALADRGPGGATCWPG
jgi:hypothetical protein